MSDPRPSEVEAARLLSTRRWAALSTVADGIPEGSMVAYALEDESGALLFFLSGLASHAGNLATNPAAALAVSVSDSGEGDPQLLPRLGLAGRVEIIDRREMRFGPLWQAYVGRFPWAAPRLGLGDFQLFRFVPTEGRFVGGFARASTIPWARLQAALVSLVDPS
jgi:putative heme iron utilization protein